jgi:hypothetical protein
MWIVLLWLLWNDLRGEEGWNKLKGSTGKDLSLFFIFWLAVFFYNIILFLNRKKVEIAQLYKLTKMKKITLRWIY